MNPRSESGKQAQFPSAFAVEASDLSKIVPDPTGSLTILDHINLTVAAGQTLAIRGASGSGKSTLLGLLAGLDVPTSGTVRLFGQDLTALDEDGRAQLRASRVGFVFQSFQLLDHLTALENVMLGPTRVLRQSRAEAEPLAVELLRKVGLGHKAGDYPERLSGGQQQRVAIARSLAMQPRLMLFDEATSALDPELIGEVLNVIRALARDGMTMIIVTHEMQFAEDVADRVVFMDHGRIVDEGPPHELFRAPSHPRTQAFLRAVVDRQVMGETAAP